LAEPVRYSQLQGHYVDEFHAALETLARAGVDVDDFKVAPDSVIHIRESTSYMQGRPPRSRSYVDKAILMAKPTAVISYFELAQDQPPRSIGFRPP
jgi:hypothetical protein